MKTHGGKRINSGRKKVFDKSVRHIKRPFVYGNHLLHVNMKLKKGMYGLRKKRIFKLLLRSIRNSRFKGLEVIHFALLSNHFHLIVRARNKETLAKGMQSLNVTFAKGVNKCFKRKGKLFLTRYFLHILKTRKEEVNAYRYVLKNPSKHLKKANIFDPYTSILIFKGIKWLFGNNVVFNTRGFYKNKSVMDEHKRELLLNLTPI